MQPPGIPAIAYRAIHVRYAPALVPGYCDFEPHRLIEQGLNDEFRHSSSVVPDTRVVARDHMESVTAWSEVRVESLASRDGSLPVFIVTLKK